MTLYLQFPSNPAKTHLGIEVFLQRLQIMNNLSNPFRKRRLSSPTLPFLQCNGSSTTILFSEAFPWRGTRDGSREGALGASGSCLHLGFAAKWRRLRGFEVGDEDPSCREHGGFVVEAVTLGFPLGSVNDKYMGLGH